MKALGKLKSILTNIDDAVALYQTLNDFRRIFDLIDPKSYTYVNQKHEDKTEQKKFTVCYSIRNFRQFSDF